jgi:glycosyltransferase involved in cell wall biosynthesis
MAPKVTYCLVDFNRKKLLQKAIRHTSPHVDRTICIDGGSKDGSVEWLKSQECKDLNVEVFVHLWEDNPPKQRNFYLDYAGNNGWVLVTDDDEYLEEPAAWSLRNMAEEAEKNGVSLIRFNSHDVQISAEGKVWEHKSDYWNPMFFKMGPGVRYKGHTHVSLDRLPGKVIDSPFRYFHCKSVPEEFARGARNYWTTARVASNIQDEDWLKFKKLCKQNGLTYFYEMEALLRAGTVPQDLSQWMIDNRNHQNVEVCSYFITYFVFLHPELNMGISNRYFTFQPNRKPFKEIYF